MILLDFFPLISLLIFISLIMGKVFSLKRKGVQVSNASKQNKTLKILLYFLFIPILSLWCFEIGKSAFQLSFNLLPEFIISPIFNSNVLKFSGIIIVAISLIYFGATLFHFKTSLRFGLNENNPGKLITTGVFAFSRNPFFLSIHFYFLGIALIQPSLFFIGFAVLAILNIHFFILKEEKFMRKVYGDEYKKYAKKTGRYFTIRLNKRKNEVD